jgi:hypothetical protein
MKFDSLYQQVFLIEQDEVAPEETLTPEEELPPQEGGQASPDSINVEPAPVFAGVDAGGIQTYKTQLQQFADSMQNTDTECLQKLVNDLDYPGSLYMGISRELASRIIKIASDAKEIVTILDGFVINSIKRKRDIATGQK